MLTASSMKYSIFDTIIADPDLRGIHLRTHKIKSSFNSTAPTTFIIIVVGYSTGAVT